MLTPSAQTGVLGALLLWPEDLTGPIMSRVSEQDFFDPKLRRIFREAREMFLEGRLVDLAIIADRLGPPYPELIAELISLSPSKIGWEAYADELRDSRQLREIQSACVHIASGTMTLKEAEAELAEAAALLIRGQGDRDYSYTELIHRYLDRQNDDTPPDYLDWGIPQLNERVYVSPGSFVILGGDSSAGKTALALQFARHIASTGKKVGFFSYETGEDSVTDRLLANDADVALRRSKLKKLTDSDFTRVTEAGTRSEEVPLRILNTPKYTVSDIRAKVLARQFDVILIDYLQLIPTDGDGRTEIVTSTSIQLHALAQELQVTIIALSQVTLPDPPKQGPRRYITKDDLRESRQLKMDADVILLLDLSDPKDKLSNRVLIVDKNKDGESPHLVLAFDAPHMRFTYVPPPEDSEITKAKELNAKKDANLAAKKEKEKKKEQALKGIPGQAGFTELEGDDDDLPF